MKETIPRISIVSSHVWFSFTKATYMYTLINFLYFVLQDKARLYQTTTYFDYDLNQEMTQYQMGIHIHASPASGRHGFIAEVTTGSSSYTGMCNSHDHGQTSSTYCF